MIMLKNNDKADLISSTQNETEQTKLEYHLYDSLNIDHKDIKINVLP